MRGLARSDYAQDIVYSIRVNGIGTCAVTRYLAVPDRHQYHQELSGDHRRRRAPTITNYDTEEAEGFDDGDQLRNLNAPENLLMSKQFAQTVNQSMDRLPEELSAVIMLREIEGMSYEDIAKIMDCPIGTVRPRIYCAHEAIAEQLWPLLDIAKDKRW